MHVERSEIVDNSAHCLLGSSRTVQQLREVIVKVKQAPARQVLFQDTAHQVDLEERRKHLVMKVSRQDESLVSSSCTGRIVGGRYLCVPNADEFTRGPQRLDSVQERLEQAQNRGAS